MKTQLRTGRQANVRVQVCVCAVSALRDVSTQDIAIPNDGKQYRIVEIQYPEDVDPPVMDLTFEEIKQCYDIYQPVTEEEDRRTIQKKVTLIEP
jgi:hypothetical protein